MCTSAIEGREPEKLNKHCLSSKVIKLQSNISTCSLEAIHQKAIENQLSTGTQKMLVAGCFGFLYRFSIILNVLTNLKVQKACILAKVLES